MIDDMGIFRTTIEVSSHATPHVRRRFDDVMVDTGAEYNWIPAAVLAELGIAPVRIERFRTATGQVIERPAGYAIFHAAGQQSTSIVVFGEPGDMILLGAHGLEGMNLRVDLVSRELIPAGPIPAAASRAA